MAKRNTITPMDLERMARQRRREMAAFVSQRKKVPITRDQQINGTINEVVTQKHLHKKVRLSGQNTALDPISPIRSEFNMQSRHVSNSKATRGQSVDSRALFEEQLSQDTAESVPVDKISRQRRMRGFTYVPHLWAISSNQPGYQPKEIEFDENDKPIGPNKSSFVEFLGSIARNGKLAPLNYLKWSDMPKEERKNILKHVKGSFVVPVGYDARILQAVGNSWKCYKGRIKAKYYNKFLTIEENLRNRPDTSDEIGRDERVNVDHWKFLVYHWSSEQAQETSERNKRNRAQKKMQHITGKRSFAQVFDKEKELIDEAVKIAADVNVHYDPADFEVSRATVYAKCYSKNGNTSNPLVAEALKKMEELKGKLSPGKKDMGENDIYSQVLGPEKNGRVRMYGTTKSRIYGGKQGPTDIQLMAKENQEMKKRMEEQEKLIQRLLSKEEMRVNSDSNVSREVASTPLNSEHVQLHEVPNLNSAMKVGARVILKSMSLSSKFVAKGFIESISPSKCVGTEELGHDWCEIKVIVAIEPEERLIRSIGNVKKVGHAVGSSIAWPKHLVVVDRAR